MSTQELARCCEELVIAEDELAGALRTRRWDLVEFAIAHVRAGLELIAATHDASDH